MTTLAIVVLLVILLVVVVAGYVAYKHEHTTASTMTASTLTGPVTVTITNAVAKVNPQIDNINVYGTYALDSTNSYYYNSTANTNMIIYKDSGYYYGLINGAPMSSGIDYYLAQNSPSYYGRYTFCFNPDGNTVVPAQYLNALVIYAAAKPGVNCQNTAAQGVTSAGTSKTAIGPASISGLNIVF
jgi:hypothetical protein